MHSVPRRYRTRLCYYGEQCNRATCFFAHNVNELRFITDDLRLGPTTVPPQLPPPPEQLASTLQLLPPPHVPYAPRTSHAVSVIGTAPGAPQGMVQPLHVVDGGAGMTHIMQVQAMQQMQQMQQQQQQPGGMGLSAAHPSAMAVHPHQNQHQHDFAQQQQQLGAQGLQGMTLLPGGAGHFLTHQHLPYQGGSEHQLVYGQVGPGGAMYPVGEPMFFSAVGGVPGAFVIPAGGAGGGSGGNLPATMDGRGYGAQLVGQVQYGGEAAAFLQQPLGAAVPGPRPRGAAAAWGSGGGSTTAWPPGRWAGRPNPHGQGMHQQQQYYQSGGGGAQLPAHLRQHQQVQPRPPPPPQPPQRDSQLQQQQHHHQHQQPSSPSFHQHQQQQQQLLLQEVVARGASSPSITQSHVASLPHSHASSGDRDRAGQSNGPPMRMDTPDGDIDALAQLLLGNMSLTSVDGGSDDAGGGAFGSVAGAGGAGLDGEASLGGQLLGLDGDEQARHGGRLPRGAGTDGVDVRQLRMLAGGGSDPGQPTQQVLLSNLLLALRSIGPDAGSSAGGSGNSGSGAGDGGDRGVPRSQSSSGSLGQVSLQSPSAAAQVGSGSCSGSKGPACMSVPEGMAVQQEALSGHELAGSVGAPRPGSGPGRSSLEQQRQQGASAPGAPDTAAAALLDGAGGGTERMDSFVIRTLLPQLQQQGLLAGTGDQAGSGQLAASLSQLLRALLSSGMERRLQGGGRGSSADGGGDPGSGPSSQAE